MRKILNIIILIFFLFSCNFDNSKIIRKHLTNEDISIKWYYYSHITNNSSDIIEVKQNGVEYDIYEAADVITDVLLNDKIIVIKLYKPERGIIITEKISPKVFGYKIVLDSTATYNDYRNIPNGVKE